MVATFVKVILSVYFHGSGLCTSETASSDVVVLSQRDLQY